MTKYEEMIAEYEGEITFEEHDMINEGLYADNYVWINRKLTENKKLCIAAEEIGHHKTSVGDILDQTDMDKAKQEYKARKWAWRKLLSVDKILSAVALGYTQSYEIAEYLGVSEDFLVEFYEHNGIVNIYK